MKKILLGLAIMYGIFILIISESIFGTVIGVALIVTSIKVLIDLFFASKEVPSSEKKSYAFFKIVDTINSCKTYAHIRATRRMITNFTKLFQKEFPMVISNEATTLHFLLIKRDNLIIARDVNL